MWNSLPYTPLTQHLPAVSKMSCSCRSRQSRVCRWRSFASLQTREWLPHIPGWGQILGHLPGMYTRNRNFCQSYNLKRLWVTAARTWSLVWIVSRGQSLWWHYSYRLERYLLFGERELRGPGRKRNITHTDDDDDDNNEDDGDDEDFDDDDDDMMMMIVIIIIIIIIIIFIINFELLLLLLFLSLLLFLPLLLFLMLLSLLLLL